MSFRLCYALLFIVIGAPIQVTAAEISALKVLTAEPQLSCQNPDLPQELMSSELGMLFLYSEGPLACAQYDCACHDQMGCRVNSDCGACEGTPCFCSALVSPKRCACP